VVSVEKFYLPNVVKSYGTTIGVGKNHEILFENVHFHNKDISI